ncbi:hypothetical protein BUALT_Bualt15G0085300 [Buddleja alternifolia]|uniref:MORF/ORRM1/DAG-like MORF domain-containing protein n=1 Tax=Buddleja alternifolia TaxID=168488 RepID=A0AAV6WLX2_9LAMI|nr:hypothetical protein BUALT_Bualt15G0085300 [Buddleja alternifolia]
MAFHPLRLRRVLSVSSSLLRHSLHQPKPAASPSFHTLSPTIPTASAAANNTTAALYQSRRPFTSTTTLYLSYRKPFNLETDEIGPDTILFEGCDYNHWLITIDFPKDSNLTREQMIETYVNTAAQVFGSVEEAKKKIYSLSTTTYQGFQVECSEETSEKFKGLPGVVFVLPDSYIDPVNKEYGGDKYVNGEIFPRPPPIHYGRRNNRDRRPREQMPYQQGNAGYNNQGPPPQQNYGPPRQQNYGPPPPQNYGPPPPQQNYGPPPPQQNYGPQPPQQNYGPPPPQQNYGPPPPQQNYGPPRQQNYGPPPPQQNYGPPPQQNYGNTPNFPPQQNYSPPGERSSPMPPSNPTPSYQGNFNQGDSGNYNALGQREIQQGNQDSNYGSPQGGSFGQVSGGQRSFSSFGSN